MNVRDVMSASVVSVRRETPLKEVARLLAERGISGVPVVDDRRKVLGVVSEADFLVKEQGDEAQGRSILAWLFDRQGDRELEAKLHATTAGQAMSQPAVTIHPERPIREAASVMTREDVNRLPVVEDGELVGIVTRADLVEAFLVPDDQLRARIETEVIRETMWMAEDEVSLEVREGVVRLGGTVDRRSTATILERLVGNVDGVVGVDSQLRWELDDRHLAPVGELRSEPTAASVTARERPR